MVGPEEVYTPEMALHALVGCSSVRLSTVMGRLWSHQQAVDMRVAQEHLDHRPAEDKRACRTDLFCGRNNREVDRGNADRIELGLFCSRETSLMSDVVTI